MNDYVLVLNLNEVATDLPYEIIPSHVLDRATPAQVEEIKDVIERRWPTANHIASPYEHEWRTEPSPSGTSYQAHPLPRDQWKYFVINFREDLVRYHEIEAASCLTPTELILGFSTMRKHGRNGRPGIAFPHDAMSRFSIGSPVDWKADSVKLTRADLGILTDRYSKLELHDNDVVGIRQRLNDFMRLRHLGRGSSSNLALLGYFALIESILTHEPKQSDPYDSITRQMKTKIALLNNRFDTPLDFTAFGNANPDTVWNKLYGYRSRIAHGGQADFAGDFQVIQSHETALAFVRSAVKALLVHALKEPKLMRDLQQC